MARINAGSALINQYTPPFVIPSNIQNNWHLRWNNTLKAFEAYDPMEGVPVEDRPAWPVEVVNLPAGPGTVGLYVDKVVAGETQTLNFKSLNPGAGITFTDEPNYITISAEELPTFSNIGAGVAVLVNPTADPLVFRAVAGDGDRIITSLVSDTITFQYRYGYVAAPGPTYVANINDRIIGVTNTAAPMSVTIPLGAAGVQVIVKDETGGASLTNPITVESSGGAAIDGQSTYVITTAYGHVTLYSNGANWFIIK